MAWIYHLTPPMAWEKALDKGIYHTLSLEKEGFIHCSTKEQVLTSATLHFPDETELVVLEILDKRVKAHLKWETSRNGELFPHLYQAIDLEVVETTYMLSRNSTGEWQWIY